MRDFETNGTITDEGIIKCPKCESESFKIVSHFDGKEFYGTTYNCNKCKAVIWMKHKRDKASQIYWD